MCALKGQQTSWEGVLESCTTRLAHEEETGGSQRSLREQQGHESKQPGLYQAGGGRRWEYAKVHMKRTKVESGSRTTDYHLRIQTLKVSQTPRRVT